MKTIVLCKNQRVSVGLNHVDASDKQKKIFPFLTELKSQQISVEYQEHDSPTWKVLPKENYHLLTKGIKMTKYIYCENTQMIRLRITALADKHQEKRVLETSYFHLHRERDQKVNRKRNKKHTRDADGPAEHDDEDEDDYEDDDEDLEAHDIQIPPSLRLVPVALSQRFRRGILSPDNYHRVIFGQQTINQFSYIFQSKCYEGDPKYINIFKDFSLSLQSGKAFTVSEHRTLIKKGSCVKLIFNNTLITDPIRFEFSTTPLPRKNKKALAKARAFSDPPCISPRSDLNTTSDTHDVEFSPRRKTFCCSPRPLACNAPSAKPASPIEEPEPVIKSEVSAAGDSHQNENSFPSRLTACMQTQRPWQFTQNQNGVQTQRPLSLTRKENSGQIQNPLQFVENSGQIQNPLQFTRAQNSGENQNPLQFVENSGENQNPLQFTRAENSGENQNPLQFARAQNSGENPNPWHFTQNGVQTQSDLQTQRPLNLTQEENSGQIQNPLQFAENSGQNQKFNPKQFFSDPNSFNNRLLQFNLPLPPKTSPHSQEAGNDQGPTFAPSAAPESGYPFQVNQSDLDSIYPNDQEVNSQGSFSVNPADTNIPISEEYLNFDAMNVSTPSQPNSDENFAPFDRFNEFECENPESTEMDVPDFGSSPVEGNFLKLDEDYENGPFTFDVENYENPKPSFMDLSNSFNVEYEKVPPFVHNQSSLGNVNNSDTEYSTF